MPREGAETEKGGADMKKVVLFAFNGDFMCFIHVLLNALDMKEKGYGVKIVIEGSATKLIPELRKEGNPMHASYQRAKDLDLIAGVCKACSNKMGTADAAKEEGFTLLDDMSGHPGMASYQKQGFEVITF
jgi:hypothetical protein